MRIQLFLLPALFCSAPAWSQPLPQGPVPGPIQIPRELTDPATVAKLGNAMQALSNVLLDMKVGEVKAAMEGRQATAAEKKMTVRDLGRKDDPNFDRNLQRQVAQAGPMLQKSMQALTAALPDMMQGLEQASKAIERAAANMPDPTYPKR